MTADTAQKRPNIVLIVADDLGFSDIGCFGSEIPTPNLDRLAKGGTRFTNFHTAAACSPTRSMIMSGTDNHLAGLGGMIEIRVRPKEKEKYEGRPGHEGFLGQNLAILPELMQDAGYHTIMTGKWHLGNNKVQTPASRGFERDWSFMWGAHNHYAWEPQFDPNNKSDNMLGGWLKGLWTKQDMYTKNGQYIDVDGNLPYKKDGFYSTETFTDHLLEFLEEWKEDSALRAKPFFSYHAFTAPHWPLQAPREIREKYRGKYDMGPAVLREQRLAKLKELGLMSGDIKPHPVQQMEAVKLWDEMTPEEKVKSARAMEVYAAMVEMIDTNVGRIISFLEKAGELDNTLIMFMSDNGADGGHMEATPVMGPHISQVLQRWYNNELENVGEPDSFVWYGPYWAQAATAPGRLYKMASSEGGIRVPFVAQWPKTLEGVRGPITDQFSTCMDLLPTFLALAGGSHPGPGTYKGREVLGMTGQDWTPWLKGQSDHIWPPDFNLGWELHGRAAYRRGNYKILWMPVPLGKAKWELFDLSKDPGETCDLAESLPEILQELLKGWDEYVISKGVLWGLKGDPNLTTNPHLDREANGDDSAHDAEAKMMDDPKGWMGVVKKKVTEITL